MSLVPDPPAIDQPNPFDQLLRLLKARVADLQQQADAKSAPNPDFDLDSAKLSSASEICVPLRSYVSDLSVASFPGPAANAPPVPDPSPAPENQTPALNPSTTPEDMTSQPTEAAPPPQPSAAATQSPQPQSPKYVPPENPAVKHCVAAWNKVLKDPSLNARSSHDRNEMASHAYRDAMPPPDGRENIRDFVACVSKAMLIGAIEYHEGPKLLYAAQIANSSCDPRPSLRQPGRPRNQLSEDTAPPAS